eukprot:CAMPEP_0113489562 /NCGR_PEP_ID=MMETSP0014_2-20120614/26592_1 /TAXON_ID=2857 /ORGANISM="Nitzschia sp." /LENGTH=696 /DNA_ID=CAMNT_0000383301 /DNA_START=46 /DNA_END=2136 /DNA_ORIENTATION=+ /assembly_acc=CAM_ASM_000159
MMPQHRNYRNGPQIDNGRGGDNNNVDDTIDALSERLLPDEGSPSPPLQQAAASPPAVGLNINDEEEEDQAGRRFHEQQQHPQQQQQQQQYHHQHHQQQQQQQPPVVSLATSVSVDEILGSDPFLVGGDNNNNNDRNNNAASGSNSNNIKNKVMRMMRMDNNTNNKKNHMDGGGGGDYSQNYNNNYLGEEYSPSGGGRGQGHGHGQEDDEFNLNDPTTLTEQQAQQRSQPQVPEYRDASFAIAFLLQVCIVTFLALFWGVRAMNITSSSSGAEDDDQQQQQQRQSSSSSSTSYLGVLGLCLLSSILSLGVATVSLNVMTQHAAYLIQGSLGGCIVLLTINTIALFMSEGIRSFFPWLWLILLLAACLYIKKVWYRIPFAASTLHTALECLRLNAGIYVLAYIVSAVALVWVLVWMTALVGISVHHYNNSGMTSSVSVFGIIFLLISYHWTAQVLKNVLQVTVSGVVGTWWFDPQDASSLFSPAIQDSWKRATSYSFGSICMGSLLVAIIQTLQSMARSARRNNRCGLLLCIVECLLLYIQRVAKYFNKWAMVYVALYGYDYMTSGRKVLELFQARGWNTIITDDLIHRTISMVSIAIGAMAGLFGMLTARATGWATAALTADGIDSNSTDGMNMVFLACFLIGFSLAGILMSTVLSATDAVIVCLAEAPQPFQENHPGLASDMIQKWRAVYPDECGL